MNNELPQLLPINIIVTSFNRINLLERTIDSINKNTVYPHKIFVVDNASTDGSVGWLKTAKTQGKIFDVLLLEKNDGQSVALNKAFAWMQDWEKRRPSDNYFITTNEDILAPNLGRECWLTRLKILFDKYEKSHNIGGLCLRIERTPRTDIKEDEELIRMYKNLPSVFRMLKRDDFTQLGPEPFRKLNHYDSNSMATTIHTRLLKKCYMATHIYSSHIGFTANKGYQEGFKDYFTYSGEHKDNIHIDKPYPDIDPETFVPTRANHPCDEVEQKLRDEHQAKLRGEIKDTEITVIVLTYNRYDGLNRIIESIKKHTNDIKYSLLVVADGDDTEAYNYCMERNIPCILSSWNRDFTAQANLGIYACETPYFFLVADDMEIIQPNWLSEAVRVYKERFLDNVGILTVDEGLQHGRIFTTGMSSKKFVHFANGNFFYPKYVHYGGDNELSFWTKHFNYYHYEESIKINHYHPTHKDENMVADNDATYEVSNKFMHQDQALKKERKSDINELIKVKNYYDYLGK